MIPFVSIRDYMAMKQQRDDALRAIEAQAKIVRDLRWNGHQCPIGIERGRDGGYDGGEGDTTMDTVNVTLSRRTAESWLGDLRDTIDRLDMLHAKNPNYPAIVGYFNEFPHVREVINALSDALVSGEGK